MSESITLDFDQIKSLIGQCDDNQKIELVEMQEKDVFPRRFSMIIQKFRNIDITPEDILKEVETVRRERYNK